VTGGDDHRPAWDEHWLQVAALFARRSLCDGGAGAVVVSADNRVAYHGYAGPAASTPTSGVTDCTAFCGRHRKPVQERDPGYLDCVSVHAEMNTLIHADRSMIAGGTFYVSRAPCWTCAKMIRNSGVRRYVYPVGIGTEIVHREERAGSGGSWEVTR
jgi:dCMP deaminase